MTNIIDITRRLKESEEIDPEDVIEKMFQLKPNQMMIVTHQDGFLRYQIVTAHWFKTDAST